MASLAIVPQQGSFTPEQVALIKSTIAVGATDDELRLFLYVANKTSLDPLTRQIYAIKRSGKMTIQTGIDGFRHIADRTGKLAGISDYVFDVEDAKNPGKATVTVKKLLEGGVLADFTATARWNEYCAGGPMWAKMPYLMLGKCAEALALRKAFPADLSGVYTSEEMAQADNDRQRDEVYAEVERQKRSIPTAAEVFHIAPPPELEWSYVKSTQVLICRLLDIQVLTTKSGKSDFLKLTINGKVDGQDSLMYFHKTHRDGLMAAKGKIVKLIAGTSGKGVAVSEVLEIGGEKFEAPTETMETKARLLASTMGMTEEDLQSGLKYAKTWSAMMEMLEQRKIELEAK